MARDSPHSPGHLLLADAVRIFAGAERFLLDAATGLANRGYRVTVQAFPESPLATRAAEAGLHVHEVTTRADGAPWTVAPLLSWLREQRVDAVLTNYDKDLRTVGWAARMLRRPTAILHSRECDTPLKDLPHYRFFYNRVAHEILCNSSATRRTTLASAPWLSPERVHVLPKGVDTDRFRRADGRSFRDGCQLRPGELLLGFAGQLVPRKRCAELLEMLASPELVSLPWRLAVAGSGPEDQSLRSLAAALGLEERVRFFGQLDDMPAFMAGIDLLLLPSLVEGFGYVLAEAASAGTPAVAYAASSVPEVVVDGETGLLADPREPASFVAALSQVLSDAPLRERLGSRAASHAQEHFALETMVDRLESRIVRCYQAVRGSAARIHSQEAGA